MMNILATGLPALVASYSEQQNRQLRPLANIAGSPAPPAADAKLPGGKIAKASPELETQLAEQLAEERRGKKDLRRVQLLNEGRNEHDKVYLNADGSKSLVHTLHASSYKDEKGKWQEVDAGLIEDKTTGKWRTKANSWQAAFGDLAADGIQITKDSQTATFAPIGGNSVKPHVTGEAPKQVVTYRNVWQGVDLEYRVSGSQLKENIIIKSRAAQTEFAFKATGVNLSPEATPGSFSLSGAFAGFNIAPASVMTADKGLATDKSVVKQDASNNQINVSLDTDWLKQQPVDAFPVVIDPTINVGTNYYAFGTDGTTEFLCNPGTCGANIAGKESNGYLWRFAYQVNSSVPTGKYLVSAKLHLEVEADVTASKQLTVSQASCTNDFDCIGSAYGESTGSIATVGDIDVTTVYSAAWTAGNSNPWMMVRGEEAGGLSVKQFDETKTSVTINYEELPSNFVKGAGSPTDQGVVVTTQPTLFTDPATVVDSDGPAKQYRFIIGRTKLVPPSNPFNILPSVTGILADSQRQLSNQWTVPDNTLKDGETYYWQPVVWDTYDGAPDVYGPVYSFRIDLRNGKDATQAFDSVGPVTVDLATGNLTAANKSHSIAALAGGMGVSLDYNSPQRSRNGLVGEYWNDDTATRVFPSTTAPLIRVDPNVNFNWGANGPHTGVINNNNFLVRWSGFFVAPSAGTYQFGATSDDGVKIYINNVLNLDAWTSNPTNAFGTGVALTAGQVVPIKYEYFEGTGSASTQLLVKSGSISQQIMPTDWLQTGVRPIAASHGLVGRYYTDPGSHTFPSDSSDPTRLFLTRTDPSLSQIWGTGSPVPGGPVDNFLVRWKGFFTAPVQDNYRFGAGSDDGVRIYLNGSSTPVVNAWSDHGASPVIYDPVGINLNAGQTIPITVEYYEHGGSAQMVLFAKQASLPSAPDTPVASTSLSPEGQILPDGWNLGIDANGNLNYDFAYISQGSVILHDSTGKTHEYKYTNGGFTPPPGEQGRMVRNSDGTVTLEDADGRIYVFNSDGTIRSATTSADDRNPAALQYTYGGIPAHVRQITDGVNSSRWAKVYVGGDKVDWNPANADACPTSPSGYIAAPAGLICAVVTSDGQTTKLFYTQVGSNPPNLARVEQPGGEMTDYGYDAALGRITSIRDSLAADAVAAGIRTQNNSVLTLLTYDSLGKVKTVTLPEATAGATRIAHSYDYFVQNETHMHVTNATEPNGFSRKVAYDATYRTLQDTDVANLTTTTAWHATKDLVLSTTDPAGLMTTNLYDYADRLVDEYGPAPATWFGSDRKPLATPTDYTPQVPHEQTAYDENINGLAAAYYNVGSFSNGTGASAKALFGSPKLHTTGVGPTNGDVVKNWGGTPPFTPDSGYGWGVRLSGWIHFTPAGNHTFKVKSDDGVRLLIDDQIVVQDWVDGTYPGNQTNRTKVYNNTCSPADCWKRVQLDYYNKAGDTDAQLELLMTAPGGSETNALGSLLKAGYGLTTTQKTFDSHANVGDAVTTTSYGTNPELSLAHNVTSDPTGLALATTSTYETQGASGSFLRRLSTTLPGGGTTTYSYYTASETRDNPCTAPVEAHKQAGMLKLTTEPDPDGGGAATSRTIETVYDDGGRVVATRFNAETSWTCMTYDSRNRISQKAIPANFNGGARTIAYDYAVGGNPLVTSTNDSGNPLVTTTDLLGRTVSYQDRNNTSVTPTTTTYDNVGRLISRNGKMGLEEFTYDNFNRLTGVKLAGITLGTPSYDTFGRLQQVTFPRAGQQKQVIGRDSLGRVNSYDYTLGNGTTHHIDSITLSQSGQVVSGTELTRAKSYTYDKANRLTAATLGTDTYAYSYAAPSAATCNLAGTNLNAHKSGNRTSQTVNGVTTTYCYDNADRLNKSSDASLTTPVYDAHGNTSSIGQAANTKYISFGYDSSDRTALMHQIYGTTGNKWITQYEYDAADRLRARFEDNGPAPSIWESFYGYTTADDMPDYEMDNAWNVRERYIQMPGGVLFTIRSNASSYSSTSNVYSLPNIHGDTMVTTNGAGTQTNTFTYEPFGKITSAALPDNTNGRADFDHMGQYMKQTETLFGNQPQIMGARVYMSVMGRFMQVDPVEGGNANAYTYPLNPVNQADINGKFLFLVPLLPYIATAAVAAVTAARVLPAVIKAAPTVVGIAQQAPRLIATARNSNSAAQAVNKGLNKLGLGGRGVNIGGYRVALHAPHNVDKRLSKFELHQGYWHWHTGPDRTPRHLVKFWREFKR